MYAIEKKDTNEFIGFTGLFVPSFNAHFTPAIEIGWRIDSKHWGQGFAPEAAKKVIEYAFSELNLKEIVSFTSKINLNSIKVMQKIGMTNNPKDNFMHPMLDNSHPLCGHVLYKIYDK